MASDISSRSLYRRTLCDGQPTCSQCFRRGIKCEYRMIPDSVMKKVPAGTQLVDNQEAASNAEAAGLLSMLKNVSDGEAFEALQLLRNGRDPAELTAALRDGVIGLSQTSLEKADLLPQQQHSLEFELMMKHPIAYPIGSLVRSPNMDPEHFLQSSGNNKSATNAAITVHENLPQPDLSPFGVRQQVDQMGSGSSRITGLSPPSKLFSNRLLSVEISRWTKVPISNELSIKVLSLYFEVEHPLMPLFDVEFFLEGLLGNNQFCSCLLINALFAWACLKYATVDPEVATVGHAFYDESKKLWAKNKDTTSTTICTMAALQYMSITAFAFGAGEEHERYLCEMSDMAEILELFGPDPTEPQGTGISNDTSWQLATAQMAWAIFNYLTIYYHMAVLDLMRPLTRHSGSVTMLLRPFGSKKATPNAVQAASVNQLKKIVLHYRKTYPEPLFSLFWHSALLYLANAVLQDVDLSGRNPEWRFYFRLCLTCYQTLYSGYPLVRQIAQSLLSMALTKGVMEAREAVAILEGLEMRGKHRRVPDQKMVSLIVDLDLAVTDAPAARLETLAQKFRQIQIHGSEQIGERDA
ncbi:hypothetical protein CSUB01_03218 [Colletotrichum sublineola]|uniref:Zn(2)-C6 fungal-type domain-containing protein n=1 Tax=Colletotrichum sublineola TaxID=1173701 RepID=A0A066X2C6_COLSU|nr:hypothetical protein CSUB01_03218 [Colletotrichum sublineola]